MSRAALSVRPIVARKARLRDEVFARDCGVCAICGKDTEALRLRLKALCTTGSPVAAFHRYREELKALGLKTGQKLWEADHAQPLCESGHDGLTALRTLCVPCHRKVTRDLRARLSRRPLSRKCGRSRSC